MRIMPLSIKRPHPHFCSIFIIIKCINKSKKFIRYKFILVVKLKHFILKKRVYDFKEPPSGYVVNYTKLQFSFQTSVLKSRS